MEMYKKAVAITIAIFSMFFSAAAAKNGDVIGTVKYSALDTYINNYPINAYHYDDYQMVCAEDLRDYGFKVIWNKSEKALYIDRDHEVKNITGQPGVTRQYFLQYKKAHDILKTDIKVYVNGLPVDGYAINGKMMIRLRELEVFGYCQYSAEENYSKVFIDGIAQCEYAPIPVSYDKRLIVVLDPGHGKSSAAMTDEEKTAEGYVLHSGKWGEWRHWKKGTAAESCRGSGCNHDHTCFYPISSGDRDAECDINLQNARYAKWYLENELGYTVRMTRTTNEENPSFSKRVSYCYPDNDMSVAPDAACYICIHSNAGGGRGTAYITAGGNYTQKWITNRYVPDSNSLGRLINERIVSGASLSSHSGGHIDGEGYLIAFNKSPVPVGYLEIGFFDNKSDLAVLKSQRKEIGRAIADGVNEFLCGN